MSPASATTTLTLAAGVYEELRRQVQERLGAANLDRDREPDRIRAVIETVVERYSKAPP